MTNLYSLRDSKRRLTQIECVNNDVCAKYELIYLSDSDISQIQDKVHERDRLGAINGESFLECDERRKFNYVIVNMSKKFANVETNLIVCRDNAFAVIEEANVNKADKVIGQYVGEIRFDTLTTFDGFSK